jgi:glycosyltransferase involved in cell wall biosynthesis
MTRRRIILLLIPHLGGGGAERVAALLACGFNRARYEVHVGLVTQDGTSEHGLPPWVTVHGLGARRVRRAGLAVLRLMWILRPDVVLSGMAHLNKLILLLRPLFPRNTRVLVRQNGQVSADGGPGSWKLYPRADAIICQTMAMATELTAVAGSDRAMCVLPNPVDVDGIRLLARQAVSQWGGPGPHILAVGRLAGEKGFDLLLQAFASLRSKFPQADLTILGEGRERPALEMLAWVLGVGSSVRMPGHVAYPAEWYPEATVFVLSSRHEGLPNALLEAAAGGLPIVATRASAGLMSLIEGQPGVWVAREASAAEIAEALHEAIQMAQIHPRFLHGWVEPFRLDAALAQYEALIEEQFSGVER